MIAVKAQLILHPEKEEQTGRHSNSQANYVDKRIAFVLPDVSQGDFQVIFKHGFLGTFPKGTPLIFSDNIISFMDSLNRMKNTQGKHPFLYAFFGSVISYLFYKNIKELSP